MAPRKLTQGTLRSVGRCLWVYVVCSAFLRAATAAVSATGAKERSKKYRLWKNKQRFWMSHILSYGLGDGPDRDKPYKHKKDQVVAHFI